MPECWSQIIDGYRVFILQTRDIENLINWPALFGDPRNIELVEQK